MSPAAHEAPAPGGGAGLLHNMSAPPRSIVVVNPLRPAAPIHGKGELPRTGAVPRATPSARHFARVCLVSLLGGGAPHEPMGRDIARGVNRRARLPHGGAHDLANAVALLRAGEARGAAYAAQRDECERLPLHALHDEFLERAAALGDMGLPPLLLARPVNAELPAPVSSLPLPPLAALRLLAGTAGGLFLRDRAPGVSLFLTELASHTEPTSFDYYQPAAPGAGAPR